MSSSQPVTQKEFTRACARFTTGIAIAGVLDSEGSPHGLTVNSFTSVSLEPPLILVSLAHSASVVELFRRTGKFSVNLLARDQRELSDRFARKGEDRFDGIVWHPGDTGVPLIAGVLATFECVTSQVVTAGDHDIFIGEVVATTSRDGDPLVYFSSGYRALK